VLGKLRACLDYARDNCLVPVILGDLFHWPRDSANWLLVELMELFAGRNVVAIAGNHDMQNDSLAPDDSLSVLLAGRVVRLLSPALPLAYPLKGGDGNQFVRLLGSSWGTAPPKEFARPDSTAFVCWITHHDYAFGGEEAQTAGKRTLRLKELPGIELVVNGHLHRTREPVTIGMTTWVNPGNITRLTRSVGSQVHRPAALELLLWFEDQRVHHSMKLVPVPHAAFEEAFAKGEFENESAENVGDQAPIFQSSFVTDLQAITRMRTSDGTAARNVLKQLLEQLRVSDPAVAADIQQLINEVLPYGS
jgi:predicted phosphodiesterase